LPALARWHAVMPLGGTSNHFRLKTLRNLGGWDAFNVTEDADLGVRLARRHLRTATSTSFTLEDAPDRLRPWLGQRTRWLKGWMQTFMVHNRRPRSLLKDLGLAKFLLFELTILSMLLAPLLHIAFLPMALWLVLDGFGGVANPTAWSMACLLMLGLGFAVTIFTNIEGLRRTGQRRFQLFQLLLPLYWLLISWAAVRALCEFVRRPFHWFKTPHQASSAFATSASADRSGNQSEAPTLSVQ
ncbi:MAG: glycosyltransferase, partial [Phyllobacteriaceae bacterium]|nr:glycosyltransferase [Phyllobacteriaceae bacterium]